MWEVTSGAATFSAKEKEIPIALAVEPPTQAERTSVQRSRFMTPTRQELAAPRCREEPTLVAEATWEECLDWIGTRRGSFRTSKEKLSRRGGRQDLHRWSSQEKLRAVVTGVVMPSGCAKSRISQLA